MRREDLERYLERGDSLGFQKETFDAAYLGWMVLSKLKPHDRRLSLLRPGEDPHVVAEEEYVRVCPYILRVAEMRRDAYESGACESMEDYRLNRAYFFPTLEHVEAYVRAFGRTLEEIKWTSEIDCY
jgi:hypothetical protein